MTIGRRIQLLPIPIVSMHMQEPGASGQGRKGVSCQARAARPASLGDGPRVLGETLTAGSCMGHDI